MVKWLSFGVIGAVFVFSLIGWYASHTSLWVLWGLLPEYAEGDVRLAIDLTNPAVRQRAEEYGALFLPGGFPKIKEASRYGYSKGAGGETLTLLTTWKTAQEFANTQKEEGVWQTVERFGPIVRLSTLNATALPAISESRSEWWRVMRTPSALRWPVFLLETREGMATARKNVGGSTVTIRMSREDSPDRTLELHDEVDGLLLSLDSVFLSQLPGEFHDFLRDRLTEALAFDVSAQRYEALLTHDRVQFFLTDGESAIGYRDNFIEQDIPLFQKWLHEEEALKRPIERVFSLPDGSIGTELIPGEWEPVLAPAGSDDCAFPLPETGHLLLCRRDGQVVLATNERAADALLGLEPGRWHIRTDDIAAVGRAGEFVMEVVL